MNKSEVRAAVESVAFPIIEELKLDRDVATTDVSRCSDRPWGATTHDYATEITLIDDFENGESLSRLLSGLPGRLGASRFTDEVIDEPPVPRRVVHLGATVDGLLVDVRITMEPHNSESGQIAISVSSLC